MAVSPKLKIKVKRGHWVGVRITEFSTSVEAFATGEGYKHRYTVRRVVRVSRDGNVSHVTTEMGWKHSQKAWGSTTLKYQQVTFVYSLGPYGGGNVDLSHLSDGNLYMDSFETLEELKEVVLSAVQKAGLVRG